VPEIVVTEFMDDAVAAELAGDYDVLYEPDLVHRREDRLKVVAGCRAVIVRNRTRVDAELLEAARGVEVIGRLGVGLDNIDLEACRARGVPVCPATGTNELAVAEYVIAAILILLRGAYHAGADVIAGRWPRQDLMGREASGRRLGLLGFGGIGRCVAPRARALGMAVAATDPFVAADDPAWEGVENLDLEALLGASDVLSVHVPLTGDTRRLIDATAIARMKPDAVLVNTARGGIVDDAALVAALIDGRLGGAMIDVYVEEPLGAEAAAIYAGVPNLVLTPHIAGVTEESNYRISVVTVANVRRVLEGGP
jgi:(S)-sulfolactate dehydrogenase